MTRKSSKRNQEIWDGTFTHYKQAWLITWEWTGKHAKVANKIVAILDYRRSETMIENFVEQIYISSQFAYHEQLAYAKKRKFNPYPIQHGRVTIPKETQEKHGLPSSIPTSDDMICGGNPYLWARRVYDVEAFTDKSGKEHLRWKDRLHSIFSNGKIISDWSECHWIREDD